MKNRPVIVDGKEQWISRSVAAVTYVFAVVDGDVCVLVNKRGPGLPNNVGKWNAPSGFLDYDETIEECAVREVFEETGLNINKHNLHFLEVDSNPERRNQVVLFRYWYAYRGGYTDTITTKYSEPDEVEEVGWIPIFDLAKLDWVSETHLRGLLKALGQYLSSNELNL